MNTQKYPVRWLLIGLCLCAVLPFSALWYHSANAASATFIVNSNGDQPDANVGDGICDVDLDTPDNQCTLRAALREANANADTTLIQFEAAMTISPLGPLPVINAGTTGQVKISGGNQGVILDGSAWTNDYPTVGLEISGSNNTVQGITIQNFNFGIKINGDNNIIGVDDADSTYESEGNTIISNDESIESHEIEAGIYITLSGSGNVIAGNFIGLQSGGDVDGNDIGILLEGNSNIIGTDGDGNLDAYERNIISGNSSSGVFVRGGDISPKPAGNHIAGNFIGLNANGDEAKANGGDGILIDLAGTENVVGMNSDNSAGDSAEGNIISGNNGAGIQITYSGSTTVTRNQIGTDSTGMSAIPNISHGVKIDDSDDCIVGVDGDGVQDHLEGNLISGNGGSGVVVHTSDTAVIAGNRIGLKANGTEALGNTEQGIEFETVNNSRIGTNANNTSDELERNVVSGNIKNGILFDCFDVATSSNNIVAGNYIGTQVNGESAVANQMDGIFIDSCDSYNMIGGNQERSRNIISGNHLSGINLAGADTITVRNNWIGRGTNPADEAVGNQGIAGVYIHSTGGDSAYSNSLGLNVIAHNLGDGIQIGLDDFDDSTSNLVYNNSFYENGGMAIDLGDPGSSGIDPLDSDIGPNTLQNPPEFTSDEIGYSGIVLEIPVEYRSSPLSRFDLWFYSSSSCNSTLAGVVDGKTLIGRYSVVTPLSGATTARARFIGYRLEQYSYVTALVVNPSNGDTSEFSTCKQFTGVPPEIFNVYLSIIRR